MLWSERIILVCTVQQKVPFGIFPECSTEVSRSEGLACGGLNELGAREQGPWLGHWRLASFGGTLDGASL